MSAAERPPIAAIRPSRGRARDGLALLAAVLLLAAVAVPGLGRPAHTMAAPISERCDELLRRVAAFEGRIGLVVLDLVDGSSCVAGGAEQFVTASLYKIVVLAEAYRQAEAGQFAFEEEITIGFRTVANPEAGEPPGAEAAEPPAAATDESAAAGSGGEDTEGGADAEASSDGDLSVGVVAGLALSATAATRREPVVTTAAEAVRLMIQVSDNGSAEALRARLGKDNVAAAPVGLGLDDTSLGQGFTTTAGDIAELLRRIYKGELVSRAASVAMLEQLAGQQISDRLPVQLPAGTRVAHKTGNLDGSVHDAGIVFAPGGDYVIAVLTDTEGQISESYEAIRELSAIAYGAYAAPLPPVPAVAAAPAAPPASPTPVSVPAELVRPAVEASSNSSSAVSGVTISSVSGSPWWATAPGLALLLLLAASAYPAVRAARRYVPGLRPGAARPGEALRDGVVAYTDPAAASISIPGRDGRMRFGARGVRGREQDEQSDGAYLDAAIADAGTDPGEGSERLRRLGVYFQDQAQLLTEMRGQVEAETAPLDDLLERYDQTMVRVLGNLNERLRPLNEYADSEEGNLAALERDMQSQEMGYIARSFEEYVEAQRHRIDETRQQIDQQRGPFARYGADQRAAVEAALARFDDDIAALEQNLADQRRVMMRMLDAMRSEAFVAARELLQARETTLVEVADEGVTDPSQIGARLQSHREQAAEQAAPGGGGGAGDYLARVLEITDQADQRFVAAGGVASGPRPLPPPIPTPEEETEAGSTEGRDTA